MDIQVDKIYKLSDDYQEIFINNISETNVSYEEVKLSSRTIHKDYYEDLFLLEPHTTYKVYADCQENTIKDSFNTQNIFYDITLKKSVINAGLIPFYDNQNAIVYLYNSNNNMVMIRQNAIIGKCKILVSSG